MEWKHHYDMSTNFMGHYKYIANLHEDYEFHLCSGNSHDFEHTKVRIKL